MSLLHILVVGAALAGANAFGVAPRSRATTQLTSLQLSAANDNEPTDFIKKAVKTIGAISLGSLLALNAADASAGAFVPNEHTVVTPYLSSTELVSVAIKTMDMTLPTYDTISDAKNTQESLSSLVIEQPTAVAKPSKAAPKQKGEQMKGPSMSSFLPSLDKQGPTKKETAEEAAAKKAQQDAAKAEKRAEFERATVEKAAQKLERATADSEKKAKLAADKAEAKANSAQDKKFVNTKVEIVDTNMPTYSGATNSKSDSPFAI